MTKTPTEEAWESLAMLVAETGAHWRLTDSPADDCVDVPVADLRLALADHARLQAERDRAAEERDNWKRTAEHHFGHMRAALELSYQLRYPPCPNLLDQIADTIDCGGDCATAWREYDTNATGCTKSESADGCPFEQAAELRDFARALRLQAWTLAFTPPPTLPPPVKEAEPEPVAWTNERHFSRLVIAPKERSAMWGLPNGTINIPLYTAPPALQARVEALEGALREAQSVLAMLVEPGAIQQTTVINAYAAAKTAEAKARAALTGEKGQ